ncbi:MAG: hypothetical protein AUJ57_11215 [Zetaproteobacteria bacterium CG1_02_53_45]|nr:MAG: hypothetical protein AUJ57_11215 [Zetaproteobacteria bacterium CG1_02_53_45]
MNGQTEKKGLNYKLLAITLILAAGIVIPLISYVKSHSPDFKVSKEKITKADLIGYKEKVDAMVADYTVRQQDGLPIVHPPVGSDIYLLAKNYDWGKYTLELEKGAMYRLHLATLDMKHAIVVRELKLMNRIKVGEFKIIEFIPGVSGEFYMLCGEFCGQGHASMVGKIIVVDPVAADAVKAL